MVKRALFVLVAGLAVLLGGCGGGSGSSDPNSAAHINESSGSTHGAVPDERQGSAVPSAPHQETTLFKAAKDANCFLLQKVPAKDDKVVSMTGPAPEYEKEPPMVGPHLAPPEQQADGAYLVLPDERATVASLDNGRMTIQYAPDLPEAVQLELKGLFDTMYGGTLFFPNNKMNYAVAATTWSNGLFCAGYEGEPTLNAIRTLGKETWGKFGDEPVDKFPPEGPTPANPRESRAGGGG